MQSAADYLTYLGYRRGMRAGEALGLKKVDKKLNAASPEELERWLLAAVDAKTLRDVFKP